MHAPLDLTADPVELTAALVDIASPSGQEREIADAIELALAKLGNLAIVRDGDAIVARTERSRPTRVLLAGHLDTVPIADNVPSRLDGEILHGCGTSDMKSGVAVMLHIAGQLEMLDPWCDLTFALYDNEEVDHGKNGLGRLVRNHPEWIKADFGVLLEPTNGMAEAGCQGTMRAEIRTTGRRAHSARSWLGNNAIHAAGEILRRLNEYHPREVDIDGCVYREGLNAVGITSGVAGNVIPDECTVVVNFRFAPDRDERNAQAHMREVFAGFELEIVDSAPGALPGLTAPGMQRFLDSVGGGVTAKYGWTDVARLTALGIPAVNLGPGDPRLAHTREEHVQVERITTVTQALHRFLSVPQ